MMTQNATMPYDFLPEELQVAQEAISKPEIQEILKTLSKYNLGITMPHKHNEETGEFEVLPENEMQMENDLSVSFINRSAQIKALPVSWIWQANAVVPSQQCVAVCDMGGPRHRALHNTAPTTVQDT